MAYHPIRSALEGAAAGAMGTVALDIATYLDMTVRGRPSSGVPAQVASKIAQGIGIDLAVGADSCDSNAKSEKAQARKSGVGALMGYATGLGVGIAYGFVRSWNWKGRPPLPLAGAVLGLAAMAASDVPATIIGATDPRSWGVSGWLSDILPHLAYGIMTALAYDMLVRR